jgi:hypothetical protein
VLIFWLAVRGSRAWPIDRRDVRILR